MKSITFLFPTFTYLPVGGFKVPLEYANRLAEDGYEVHVVYSETGKYRSVSFWLWCKLQLRLLFLHLGIRKRSIRIWFPLRNSIKEHHVYSLKYNYVPKTNLYICTEIGTAPYLNLYPIDAIRKFYFIQGYENWGMADAEVRATYHYPMTKIVISSWLQQIVLGEEKESCILVRNGFNQQNYHLTIPVENKSQYEVSMLYHREEIKGCQTSFNAFGIVKQKHPELHVNIFGTPEKPADLPDWYTYYQCPSQEEHLRINNESAIYVAASIDEGWGLTVGEAMLCGQAVACTDNKGFREMAIDEETALLSPIKDAVALANNICRLIENDDLRFRLAENGMKYVGDMTLEKSYSEFKKALGLL